MKKRIMAAVLAALLSASAFTACSESNAGTNTDETQPAAMSTEAVVTETEEPEKELTDLEKRQLIPDNLPDTKYDGAEFRVYTVDAAYADYEGEILAEEITGDACNDAVYNRNIRIEDRFDIRIGVGSDATPQAMCKTLAQSGTEDYHVVAMYDFKANEAITAEAVLNWYDAPYQDMSKPWHNSLANDGATINGILYAICSDLSYTSMTFTHCFFANIDLLDQYGYQRDDLYNMVKEGKWTIDAFISMIEPMYQDYNGNGKTDGDDLYGFGYSIWNPADVWITAFGEEIVSKNDEGRLEVTFMSDKTVSILEKLLSFHYDFQAFNLIDPQYGEETNFVNNKLVFAPMRFQAAYSKLREMESEYTMLPYPKWDEAQEGYYTNADDKFSVFCLPKPSYNNLEFISCIFEALCAESYKTVYPAYYDQALKGKYSTDATTAEMVDLVMAGRKFDFTFQFGSMLFQSLPYMIRNMLQDNNPNLASAYKRIQKSLTKNLDKRFYELYGYED
ncbi:MAG: hypothetical protein IJF78_14095 [Clostridia bacterium]|nr:hypothetical protein [Clostridia bacterium]